MNGIPKTRFSGLIILIILSLILVMGVVTLLSRYHNEQGIIKRGFVILQQTGINIKSKINTKAVNRKSNITKDTTRNFFLDEKVFTIEIDSNKSVKISSDKLEDANHISTSKFFSDILDKSFFDEYILFYQNEKRDTIFYKSFNAEVNYRGKYLELLQNNLYLPASYRIFSGKKDSAMMRATWNTGFISKVIINYDKYYQFVYPIRIDNKNWYVCGLITNKKYLERERHIETWLLIFIGILLIFMLLSFQVLKLFLLSKNERVKTSDIVSLFFSISGFACIIPLLILNLYAIKGIKETSNDQLKNLNDSLKSHFITELNLMYRTTESYENSKQKNSQVITHILLDTTKAKLNNDLNKSIQKYPYFKSLFCSKNTMSDEIITTWESDKPSKISYRQYFQFKDEWVLPGAEKEKRFRIQSIYSNTSGDVSVVLAKPSKSDTKKIFCISSPMYSVINTVLPPGYEFRIIGEDGLVWFHSNSRKNVRENFLAECNQNEEILESVHNRIETTIPLKISLQNYQSYISPIGKLPLFLITLRSTADQNEFLSHTNYILLIFILVGLFYAIVLSFFFIYIKLNKAKSQIYNSHTETGLNWLFPNNRKNNRYLLIFVFNIFLSLIISIPVFNRETTIIQFFLILFGAYSVCFIYTYFFLGSFRNRAFQDSFLTESYSKSNMLSKNPYLPYLLFVFSWMFIACVLPTCLLFKVSEREELELTTRKNQIITTLALEKKNRQIDSLFLVHIYPNEGNGDLLMIDNIKNDLKQQGNYLLDYYKPLKIDFPVLPKKPSQGELNARYLLLNRYMRQLIQREDIRSFQMLYGSGLDPMWFWKGGHLGKSNSDSLAFYYFTKQKNGKGLYYENQLGLLSIVHNPKSSTSSMYLQIMVFLLFLVLLFLFIRSVIRRIFIIEKPDKCNITNLSDIDLRNSRTYLINMLHQDEIIRSLPSSYMILSHDHSTGMKSSENTIIVFNPLPENLNKWCLIFKSLDKSIGTIAGNVILLSCYSPIQIFDMIDEQIKTVSNSEIKNTLLDFRQILTRMLSYFLVYFVKEDSLKTDLIELQKDCLRDIKERKEDSLNCFLYRELSFGFTPHNIKEQLKQTLCNGNDIKEQQMKLYVSFASKYQYIWEKCTLNEKFILSDLAIDSLVNRKNKADIRNLIGKGLLDVNERLGFVSSGFRIFIIELADNDEFVNLLNNTKRADGWNKIKVPLYIIFGIVVLFFFITQQDIIPKISALIISITGLAGSLLKFGLFSKSSGNAK
jgi:hypothetical protein